MDWIRPEELGDRMETGEPVFVLDIRPETEYERYNIEGSLNAPVYHELSADGTALEPYLDEIPRDTPVVTVCRVGKVAQHATRTLSERGYDTATLAGGIYGWKGYSEDKLWYRVKMFFMNLVS